MSLYGVHKLLHRAQVDLDFRERLRTDPAEVLAEVSLTDDERAALLAGDVATLARAGVHTFLLSRIARFRLFGLDRDEYIRRMRLLAHPSWGLSEQTVGGGGPTARPPRAANRRGSARPRGRRPGDELHAAGHAVVGPAERQ